MHITAPVERPDVETTKYGAAIIRSLYCDIMVEPLDHESWRAIRKSEAYGKRPEPGILIRTPALMAFQVVIKNTLNAPIQLKKAEISYGPQTINAMSAVEVRERLNSPSYSGYNFTAMLSYRRLMPEWESLGNLDYDRDTIDMKLDFIPPRDTVLTMVAFENIPVESRKFKLRLAIAAMGNIKAIDFDFTRQEYRTGQTNNRKKLRQERSTYDE